MHHLCVWFAAALSSGERLRRVLGSRWVRDVLTPRRRLAPVSEAEQYYSALQLKGVPTALVKVPGASHSITNRPSQSAAKASAIIAWFDKYRKR